MLYENSCRQLFAIILLYNKMLTILLCNNSCQLFAPASYSLADFNTDDVGICDVSDEAWKKDIGELSLDLSGSRCVCVCVCVCPHTTICMSSYYHVCVLVLVEKGYWREVSHDLSGSSCCYICVLIQLCMCVHTTRSV